MWCCCLWFFIMQWYIINCNLFILKKIRKANKDSQWNNGGGKCNSDKGHISLSRTCWRQVRVMGLVMSFLHNGCTQRGLSLCFSQYPSLTSLPPLHPFLPHCGPPPQRPHSHLPSTWPMAATSWHQVFAQRWPPLCNWQFWPFKRRWVWHTNTLPSSSISVK